MRIFAVLFVAMIPILSVEEAAAATIPDTLLQRVEQRRNLRLLRVQQPIEPRTAPAPTRQAYTSVSSRKRARLRQRQINREPSFGEELKQLVIDLTNVERARYDLPPLSHNPNLERSAQLHAEDMYRRNYFSHDTPEGIKSKVRMQQQGYAITLQTCNCRRYSIAYGENIAKGQETAEKVVRDWMESEGHRANILSPHFDEIGIGIYGTIWVQNFGGMDITPR